MKTRDECIKDIKRALYDPTYTGHGLENELFILMEDHLSSVASLDQLAVEWGRVWREIFGNGVTSAEVMVFVAIAVQAQDMVWKSVKAVYGIDKEDAIYGERYRIVSKSVMRAATGQERGDGHDKS